MQGYPSPIVSLLLEANLVYLALHRWACPVLFYEAGDFLLEVYQTFNGGVYTIAPLHAFIGSSFLSIEL